LFLKVAYGKSLFVWKKNEKLKKITDLYQISEHLQDRVLDDVSNMRLAEQEHAAVTCFMEELQQIAGRIGGKEEKKAKVIKTAAQKPVSIKAIKKDNKKSKAIEERTTEEPMEEIKAISSGT
jgi:hypothetical protein